MNQASGAPVDLQAIFIIQAKAGNQEARQTEESGEKASGGTAGHAPAAKKPAVGAGSSAKPRPAVPQAPASDHHAGHAMPPPATSEPSAPPHAGHEMQGMDMDSTPGMDMSQQPADAHEGHDMSTMGAMPGMEGMEQQVGQEPPPPAPTDHAADRVFDPAAMAESRAQFRKEHCGSLVGMAILNLVDRPQHMSPSKLAPMARISAISRRNHPSESNH